MRLPLFSSNQDYMSAQAYGTPQRILGEFIYRGGFTLATLPKDDMTVPGIPGPDLK